MLYLIQRHHSTLPSHSKCDRANSRLLFVADCRRDTSLTLLDRDELDVVHNLTTMESSNTLVLLSGRQLVAMAIGLFCLVIVNRRTGRLSRPSRTPVSLTVKNEEQSLEKPLLPGSCTWSMASPGSCQEALTAHLCRHTPWKVGRQRSLGRRFLAFGDSTTGPHHLFKYLYHFAIPDVSIFPSDYHCETRLGTRCNYNEIMDLPYPDNLEWIPPNYTLGEGPVSFGAEHKFCSDCSGCESAFMMCSTQGRRKNSTSRAIRL